MLRARKAVWRWGRSCGLGYCRFEHARVICEIAWILICNPGARFEELGPDYYTPRSRERQTRDKIRELSRLNPGMKVLLVPDDGPGPHAGVAA